MGDRDRRNRYRGTLTADEAESLLKPLVAELLLSHHAALAFWHSLCSGYPQARAGRYQEPGSGEGDLELHRRRGKGHVLGPSPGSLSPTTRASW